MLNSFKQIEYFVIGVSAGGVDILKDILPAFAKNGRFKVFVVLHLPPSGPNLIPSLMSHMLDSNWRSIPLEIIQPTW